MKRYWLKVLILVTALLFPLWVFGDPPVYYANEIRGKVVNAETGQPIEGGVVVARWTLRWIRIGDGSTGGTINTLEAVTDKEGKYFLPSWGPRPRPPLAFLDNLDPELRFFKSNYYPMVLTNRLLSYENHNRAMKRTSEWDGKTIQLKPFDGNYKEYAINQLGALWTSETTDCVRECPKFILALDAENKRIKGLAPKNLFIPTIMNIDRLSEGNREFLKR